MKILLIIFSIVFVTTCFGEFYINAEEPKIKELINWDDPNLKNCN